MNKTTIKDLIASELSNFLLQENIKPEFIKIEVHYTGTTASIYIDPEKIMNLEVATDERNS